MYLPSADEVYTFESVRRVHTVGHILRTDLKPFHSTWIVGVTEEAAVRLYPPYASGLVTVSNQQ